MQVQSPAPPRRVSAARRWYLACQAAATAQTEPTTQIATKAGDSGSVPRSPSCRPRDHSGSAPATSAAQTSHSICHCSLGVPSMRRPR